MKAPDYYVIKDTREQQGYNFTPFGSCVGMVEDKLDTGDYTILGLENKVCIERKASPEELALNLGKDKKRFMAEIERMEPFEHKFLILEFTLEELLQFPNMSKRIPGSKISSVQVTGKYINKMLTEFQIYNDIHVLYCGNMINGFLATSNILKRINEKYTIGRQD
jgi:ERCC4-type nuclease